MISLLPDYVLVYLGSVISEFVGHASLSSRITSAYLHNNFVDLKIFGLYTNHNYI